MTEYKLKEWFIMKIYIIEGIDDINKYLDDLAAKDKAKKGSSPVSTPSTPSTSPVSTTSILPDDEDEDEEDFVAPYYIADRDWMKMAEYFRKGSNPQRLASSVSDETKLLNRYLISYLIGWTSAMDAFEWKLINQYGYTLSKLQEYKRRADMIGIPYEYSGYFNGRY